MPRSLARAPRRVSDPPCVTVLLAAHNSAAYVRQAIESILGQTFRDLELVAIDDGSADDTPALLARFETDPRVRLLSNSQNVGLAASLNRGIAAARGRYVARMDADDIAEPQRLAEQIEFLESRAHVGILSSGYIRIDESGNPFGEVQLPESDLEIRWTNLLENPFAHPAVVVRRDVLLAHGLAYDESLRAAQDYDLWSRMLRYTCGANLRAPLLRYRVHSKNVSHQRREEQRRIHLSVAARLVRDLLGSTSITSETAGALHELFISGHPNPPRPDGERIFLSHRYLDLLDAFSARHRGDPGLNPIRHTVGLRVIAANLRGRPTTALAGLWARLLAADPGLAAAAVEHVSFRLSQRLSV